jgi:hypothetical protein
LVERERTVDELEAAALPGGVNRDPDRRDQPLVGSHGWEAKADQLGRPHTSKDFWLDVTAGFSASWP